jgi:uncharacterized protein YoxC
MFVPLAFTWGDLAYLALSVFLFSTGIAVAYAFFRLAGTFERLSSLIRGVETEALPVIGKVGGTVDGVNAQMGKVDQMTDSAVDAVASVDTAVRAVSRAVTTPVLKLSGAAAGVRHGSAALRARRGWSESVATAKAAAARREADLLEELQQRGEPRA